MYHSTLYINPQLKKLLRGAGIDIDTFTLAVIKGKPAKTKNKVIIKDKRVTVFGTDFVAKGFTK